MTSTAHWDEWCHLHANGRQKLYSRDTSQSDSAQLRSEPTLVRVESRVKILHAHWCRVFLFYGHRSLPQGICRELALSHDRHFSALYKSSWSTVYWSTFTCSAVLEGFCCSKISWQVKENEFSTHMGVGGNSNFCEGADKKAVLPVPIMFRSLRCSVRSAVRSLGRSLFHSFGKAI